MRLQQRLSLSILPAILGPLLLIGGVSYYRLDDTARGKTLETMQTAVEQLSSSIEADVAAATTSVGFLAIASPIVTYVGAPDEDSRYGLYQPNVLALFTDYQTAYASNLDLRLLKPDGVDDVTWSRDDAVTLSPAVYTDFVASLRGAPRFPVTRILPAEATGEALLVHRAGHCAARLALMPAVAEAAAAGERRDVAKRLAE